ncbi:hypothetical protein M3643_12635, partial [Staphylococcus lugdunensis]|nr:hypothetical protein [Staphylococcus lugdunensis]
ITRAANMFSRLGIDRHAVVAYVLPKLPETHFVIWGGEAAGIVCAINPLLEGPAIASLLKAANAKVLVTLAPFPGTDIWSKIQPVLSEVPSLQSLVLIDLAERVQGWRRIAARAMQRRECKRLHGRAGVRGAVALGQRSQRAVHVSVHVVRCGHRAQHVGRMAAGSRRQRTALRRICTVQVERQAVREHHGTRSRSE